MTRPNRAEPSSVESQPHDPRRRIPGTDQVLADHRIATATSQLGNAIVKRAVHTTQNRARAGAVRPEEVVEATIAALPASATRLRAVVNATGVLLHTNLGRAPLSDAAIEAMHAAAKTTDVELDLDTGQRGSRGAAAMTALADATPSAEAAHVVNNGAAALALVAATLAGNGELIVARGEMVEIGDGFRIPDLLASSGARLREVGTTNRVALADYREAIGPDTGMILKVHPSNFVISGFTSSVPVSELSGLGVPVVADIGSGLLKPHAALPDEPDAETTLAAGAHVVTGSGDKLLGGPQAGLLLGRRDMIERLRRHPLARALRVDKLTLAALEASVRGPATPVVEALHQDQGKLLRRAERIAEQLQFAGIAAQAATSTATVGGGGAPGVVLSSAAVTLPESYAFALRTGQHPVLGRVEQGRCWLDLYAVPAGEDDQVVHAVREARG